MINLKGKKTVRGLTCLVTLLIQTSSLISNNSSNNISISAFLLISNVIFLVFEQFYPEMIKKFNYLDSLLITITIFNVLFQQSPNKIISLTVGYACSRILILQDNLQQKYKVVWVSIREVVSICILYFNLFQDILIDSTIDIVQICIYGTLLIVLGFLILYMQYVESQTILTVNQIVQEEENKEPIYIQHDINDINDIKTNSWDTLIENGIDSWFFKVEQQSAHQNMQISMLNKNLESFQQEQQWTDHSFLQNIKGINQSNFIKYTSESSFDFSDQDSLYSILHSLTEEDVRKELKQKLLLQNQRENYQGFDIMRYITRDPELLKQSVKPQENISINISQIDYLHEKQNDLSKIQVVHNLSSSYSIRNGVNSDFSFFINRRGHQPLLIFPAALVLDDGAHMFVLVKIIYFLDTLNDLQFYVTIDNFQEQFWQKMQQYQFEQKLNLAYDFIQRQAIIVGELINYVNNYSNTQRSRRAHQLDREKNDKSVGTIIGTHHGTIHHSERSQLFQKITPNVSIKQFSFNEGTEQSPNNLSKKFSSISHNDDIQMNQSNIANDAPSNVSINFCDQLFLKMFLMAHDNFNFLEMFGETSQDKHKFSLMMMTQNIMQKLKNHPQIQLYEIKLVITKSEVKQKIYNQQRKVEIMILNMILIAINSFQRTHSENIIKIKFLTAKEASDCINVVIVDNGQGYPKFQTSNLYDANLYIISSLKLCSSIGKEASYNITNYSSGLRQEVLIYSRNRKKDQHFSINVNQVIIRDTENDKSE